MDEGELAEFIADMLHGSLASEGWAFDGLDLGEINVTRPNGEKFVLSVHRAEDEE